MPAIVNGQSTKNKSGKRPPKNLSLRIPCQVWKSLTKLIFYLNLKLFLGLGCTLPAASIIGAKDVFSAVDLLPLNVPVGKPILSCNATGLKQTHVKVKNQIYSCKYGVVHIECRAGNGNNNCPGRILQCDMRSNKPITCTNGTLVSNRDLECKTIQIGNPQSILNCGFKDEEIDVRFQENSTPRVTANINRPTARPNDSQDRRTTTRLPEILETTTTRAPIVPPTRRTTTPEPINRNTDYDDQQALQTINLDVNDNFLVPEVQNAMKNIFPHDLFVKPSARLLPPKDYLPPLESQVSHDLASSMKGVFPMELLVVAKSPNGESVGISNASPYDVRLSENANNNKNTDEGVGFKTQLSGIDTRFGGSSTALPVHQQQDFRDRLIFSN